MTAEPAKLRNVALTGLPRSGTTLTCHLLNKLPNSVALHEPMSPSAMAGLSAEAAVDQIEQFFDAQRKMVLEEGRALKDTEAGESTPVNVVLWRLVGG